jgi:L-rhamnose mutarotase
VIRKAFRMSVHAGAEAEYERRHRPIWAELEQVLRDHGVQTYSIFLAPDTRDLFGYVEFDDEARWQAVARTDVCRRWWAHMREVMPSNPDASPVAQDLREVFHLARMPNGDGDPAAACDSAPDRALDPGRSHDASARSLDR